MQGPGQHLVISQSSGCECGVQGLSGICKVGAGKLAQLAERGQPAAVSEAYWQGAVAMMTLD